MSPRRLADLERRERWLVLAFSSLRVALIGALLLLLYALLPAWSVDGATAVLRLLVAVAVFAVIVAWQLARIVRAELPTVRAVESLLVIVALFLFIFASLYFSLATASGGAFSESLDKTASFYFAVTVLSTVGFGDITPVTGTARILVSIQMLLDLALIGVVVRLIVGAAKVGLSRASPRPPGEE